MAGQTGFSQSKVSRIERGRTLPSAADLHTWALVTKASTAEREELLRLLEAAATTASTWRTLHRLGLLREQEEVADLEERASGVRVFQPVMVPGLLQTAEYARRVMLQGNPSGQLDIAQAVEKRIERASVLYDQTKEFEFVLTEGALRWRPGPKELMAVQYDRVMQLASLTDVRLGIIPQDIEAPDAFLHPFVVFEGQEPVVSVETYTVKLMVREPSDIAVFMTVLERFRPVCVWDQEAVALISRLARDLR
jgi:transcriptional regulator with XRE-family HTH domain